MRLPVRLPILACALIAAPLTAADPVLGSSGASPNHVTAHAPTVVDSGITLVGTTVPTTIMVTIASGFTAGDALACETTGSPGATAFYDDPIGVLTLTGPTTLADWRALLRQVTFAATGLGSGARTLVFSIGGLVASANGHFYEFVPGQVDWATAKAGAAGRTYLGVAGYLATITSADENEFVRQTLNDVAWIGASDDVAEIDAATGTATFADQNAAEGHWHWVTGPEAGTNFSNGDTTPVPVAGQFADWNAGEPNNDAGSENFASMLIGAGTTGKWNDLSGGAGGTAGYVVEYGDLSAGDAVGLTASTVVNVSPDTLPVADSQTLSTPEDTDLVITLSAHDPDGDPLTFRVFPASGSGTLFQNDAGGRGAAITSGSTAVTDSAHRLIFAPAANASGTPAAIVNFLASDGTVADLGFVVIAIVAQNDAPVWLLGGAPFAGDDHRAATAGVAETFTTQTLAIVDVDAGSAVIQATLSIDHGSLTLTTAGLDFSFTADADGSPAGAGGGSATLCFRGTLAAVNTALATLSLTPEAGFSGAAHLLLAANDRGATGAGGARTGTALYRLDVAATPTPAGATGSHETWLRKATGCGAGSGFAAMILALGFLCLRRRW
jgi:hypothetical protein